MYYSLFSESPHSWIFLWGAIFCKILQYISNNPNNNKTVTEKCDKHFQYSYYHYEITQYKIMKIIIKWTSIFLIKIQNSAPAQAGSTVESFLFKGGGQCLRVPHYRSHKHWSPTNTCNNDSTVCYILCSSSWQLTFPFKPTWYWAVKKYSSENSMLPVWNKTMYKMPRASLVKAGPTLSLKKQKHSVQSAHRHCKT